VDVLARIRGINVLASSATARFAEERDPRVVAQQVGATAVVDGTVRLVADRLRVAVRLLDSGGLVRWNEQHEIALSNMFDLEDVIARRTVETLRGALTTLSHRGRASSEAVADYLRGRQALRRFDFAGAAEAFGRCIEHAPDFAPAYAGRAIALARSWHFLGATRRLRNDAEAAVREAAARAISLPETHHALALATLQLGDYRTTVRELDAALELAPTYVEAHELLGLLECETAKDDGTRRLTFARTLNPTMAYGSIALARWHALRADWDEAERLLAAVETHHAGHLGARVARVRLAAWRGNREEVRRLAADLHDADNPAKLYAAVYVGDQPLQDALRTAEERIATTESVRFRTYVRQLIAEVAAAAGDLEMAEAQVVRAAEDVLVDVDWLARVPLLSTARSTAGFRRAQRLTAERAASVWRP
jgi:eukaryotic-like serine/threonine-protein kinase